MSLYGAILVLGISGLVAQLLLLRELLITFLSNELSIGIILANWLLLEAAGAFLGGRIIGKVRWRVAFFAALTVLFSLCLPLCLYLARTWKVLMGLGSGEGLGLHQMFLASLLILLPVSLTHGALFSVACRVYADLSGRVASGIGRVYFLETMGTLAGGVLFTWLLVTSLTSFQTALGVSLVNFAALTWLLFPFRGPGGIAGKPSPSERFLMALSTVLLLLAVWALVGPGGGWAQRYSVAKQWRPHRVIHYQNSVYGNVTVVEKEGEYTFFSDGVPVITVPTPDVIFAEEFTHLPMLFHSRPVEVLVISGGAGGVLGELLKHPVEKVDYAELDPLILKLVKRFPTDITASELGDPRVRVRYRDGRLYLRESSSRYDLILLGLSDPQDLQVNRFFTREFFHLAQSRLRGDGILAFSLPGSTTYMGPELRDLNACLVNTLNDVFPHVRVLPGDGFNLFLASPGRDLSRAGGDALAGRLGESGVKTSFLNPFNLSLKLDRRRAAWFEESLAGATERTNGDFEPLGVFYSLSHWNAQFSRRLQGLYAAAGRLSFPLAAAFLVLAAVPLLAAARRGRPAGVGIVLAIGSTGLAGMILALALIFTFQALYGVVFFWVGLLVTAFMGGTAAGSFMVTRRLEGLEGGTSLFLKVEAAMVLFSAALPLIFFILKPWLERPGLAVATRLLFLVLSFLAGLLIGCEFPLAGKIYLGYSQDVGGAAGLLYGADLLGGWVGGIAGGVILLPVLGLLETGLLLALLKMISLLTVAAGARS
jgi:spermidine synthase